MRLHQRRHTLQGDLLEKLKLCKHAYKGGLRLSWDEASILRIDSNSRYRKYPESVHMACLTNPSSQISLDISTIWILFTSNEVTNLRAV
jgi:hypothetical protein